MIRMNGPSSFVMIDEENVCRHFQSRLMRIRTVFKSHSGKIWIILLGTIKIIHLHKKQYIRRYTLWSSDGKWRFCYDHLHFVSTLILTLSPLLRELGYWWWCIESLMECSTSDKKRSRFIISLNQYFLVRDVSLLGNETFSMFYINTSFFTKCIWKHVQSGLIFCPFLRGKQLCFCCIVKVRSRLISKNLLIITSLKKLFNPIFRDQSVTHSQFQ